MDEQTRLRALEDLAEADERLEWAERVAEYARRRRAAAIRRAAQAGLTRRGIGEAIELTGGRIQQLADQFDAAMAERVRRSQSGIGALFAGDVTRPDRDGWSGDVAVSDGRSHGSILVSISGSDGGYRGMPIDTEALSGLVERWAGRFPRERRFDELIQSMGGKEHGLLLAKLFPDDWRSIKARPDDDSLWA